MVVAENTVICVATSETVTAWLHHAKTITDDELPEFAGNIRCNQSLIESLVDLFEARYSDTEVMEPICSQLLQLYRYGNPNLRLFVLQFVPALIGSYLTAVSRRQRKHCGPLEALILGMYNLEIVDIKDGSSRTQQVRIPSLASASVYHDPLNLSTLGLTESGILSRIGTKNPYVVELGPYPSVASLNSQNKFLVLTLLLRIYNAYQSDMHASSSSCLCRVASRLASCGFRLPDDNLATKILRNTANNAKRKESSRLIGGGPRLPGADHAGASSQDLCDQPRVPLHPSLLLELVNGIYYVMFNDFAIAGIQALEDIHHRCQYELFADVLMVTQAIINSLMENPSGHPTDGPVGLRVTSESKSPTPGKGGFVTNASLRIKKKLPEDIPIRAEADDLKSGYRSPRGSGKHRGRGRMHPKGTDRSQHYDEVHKRMEHLDMSTLTEVPGSLKISRSELSFSAILDSPTTASAEAKPEQEKDQPDSKAPCAAANDDDSKKSTEVAAMDTTTAEASAVTSSSLDEDNDSNVGSVKRTSVTIQILPRREVSKASTESWDSQDPLQASSSDTTAAEPRGGVALSDIRADLIDADSDDADPSAMVPLLPTIEVLDRDQGRNSTIHGQEGIPAVRYVSSNKVDGEHNEIRTDKAGSKLETAL